MSTITPAKATNHNNVINDLLRQIGESPLAPDPVTDTSTSSLSQDHLSALLSLIQQQQHTIDALNNPPTLLAPTTHIPQPSLSNRRPPEYYNNAKYEDIISKPLKPLYDGSSEQLIPFLNRLDIGAKMRAGIQLPSLTFMEQNMI
jgi:hypothetical protein